MSKVELSGFGSVAVQKKLYLKAYISFHFIGKIIADPHLGSSE